MVKKIVIDLCLGVSAVTLVVWPIVFFCSIFLFDAPISSLSDKLWRWLLFLTFNTYPLTFALALAFLLPKRKRKQLQWWHSIPALAAALQLCVPIVLMDAYHQSTLNHDIQLSNRYVYETRHGIKRIIRAANIGGKEQRQEVVPIQVTGIERKGDLVVVRQIKAERWGGTGLTLSPSEVSFWTIELSAGRKSGPFSEDELKRAYHLAPESSIFNGPRE